MKFDYSSLKGAGDYAFTRVMHTSRDGYEYDTIPSTIVWEAKKGDAAFVVKRIRWKKDWRRERRLIGKLPQHKGLALPLDAFRTAEGNFVVQELAEGRGIPRSLYDYYKMGFAQLIHYAMQVGDAIDALNQSHVHCDLRVRNVIVHKDDARLIDFDRAGKIGSHYTTFFLDWALSCIPEERQAPCVRRDPEIDRYSLRRLVHSTIETTIDHNKECRKVLNPYLSLIDRDYFSFRHELERIAFDASEIDERLTELIGR